MKLMLDVNLTCSTDIYKQFINGRVINKYVYNMAGEREENPLFTEVFMHFNDYKKQYLMSGMELVAKDDFYYVRDNDSEMPYTDAVKRIQTLLLIIGRFVTQQGVFEKLTHSAAGLTQEDIQTISANEDFNEILMAADMPDLAQAIKSNLLERGIIEEPSAGRYVLSVAGNYFFQQLFAE